jgi:phosphomannomutase
MKDASFIFLRWLALFLALAAGFLVGAEKYIGSKIEEYQTKASKVKLELSKYRKASQEAERLLKTLQKTPLPTVAIKEFPSQDLELLVSKFRTNGLKIVSSKRGDYLLLRVSGTSPDSLKLIKELWDTLKGSLVGLDTYKEQKGTANFALQFLVKVKKKEAGR